MEYETRKKEVLGPLLTTPAGFVYSAVAKDMLGLRKELKRPIEDGMGLYDVNLQINNKVTKRITMQLSPQYWVSRFMVGRAVSYRRSDRRVPTFASDSFNVLDEGLRTGITMPFNALYRLVDTSEAQASIHDEHGGSVAMWAAATLLRPDMIAALHRISNARNGSLGNSATTPNPLDTLSVEHAFSEKDPFMHNTKKIVEYDDQGNIIVPGEIRVSLRGAKKYDPQRSLGCPARFNYEHGGGDERLKQGFTLIEQGVALAALVLLDRAYIHDASRVPGELESS